MGRCPDCGESINYVRYRALTTEYGTYDGSGHEHEEYGDSDEYSYNCPECDHEFRNMRAVDAALSVPDDENHPQEVPHAWNTHNPPARPAHPVETNSTGVPIS